MTTKAVQPPQVERRIVRLTGRKLTLRAADGDGDEDAPRIEGYAAVFYDGTPETEFDVWGDGTVLERIMPGTFERAIEEDDVRALFNHSPDKVLGRKSADTLELEEDETGLFMSIDVPDTTVGNDVLESVRRGDVTGASFSFIVTDEDFRKEDGVRIREISGVQLFDVGPVTFPAFEGTSVDVRAVGDPIGERNRMIALCDRPDEADQAAAKARRRRRLRVLELEADDPAAAF